MKKLVYWVLQFTWGALLTIPGLFLLLFLFIFRKIKKISSNGYSYIVEFGGNWGGVNLGLLSFCGNYSSITDYADFFEYIRRHEYGHSFQNIIFGPLHLFIVAIPSACRYWYQVYKAKHGVFLGEDWYQSAWFESQATSIGYRKLGDK